MGLRRSDQTAWAGTRWALPRLQLAQMGWSTRWRGELMCSVAGRVDAVVGEGV